MISCIFQGIFEKTPVLKISDDSRKSVFGRVLFKQLELSNLSHTTILKTDSIANVSCVSRIFKIAMRTSVMESFVSKVSREISAYYNSVENSIMCIFFF